MGSSSSQPTPREHPLAELLPLWRTVREAGTTALVTPALDYVGALELGGLDVRFADEDAIRSIGEGLRSFLSGLDDGCNLLFLYRVYEDAAGDIDAFEAKAVREETPSLRDYSRARASCLRQRTSRRSRLFLFFSDGATGSRAFGGATSRSPLERGHLGMRLLFRKPEELTVDLHRKKLKSVTALRDRLVARLLQLSVPAHELMPFDVWQLHYELLNPSRARRKKRAPKVAVRDNLWSAEFIAQYGKHLLELTEAEQLCFEDLEDHRGYFPQGDVFRRVATLKVLPEGGTSYFLAQPLQSLALRGADGQSHPFGYTLAVAINLEAQAFARWKLNTQHRLVEALRGALPFLANKNVSQSVADEAQQHSIRSLFVELNELASKVCTVSVSVLLDGRDLNELDARTEAAKSAFSRAGNSELRVEEVAQVPAFLSMLPGSGPYQLRRQGCTSRNAADFIPLFAPWCGGEPQSVWPTPSGELFRFGLFDKSFGVNAFHGLVAADTGSGKSFTVGALMLDALAAGLDGILVDNGNSWKQLTEWAGGTHIPVDLNTSICPFLPFKHVASDSGELDVEIVRQVVRFIEVCVTDNTLQGFDLLQQDVIARAVSRCYQERFRARPEEKPLLGDFRDFLLETAKQPDAHPRDKEAAAEIALRLRMFCDDNGVFANFLNRPSKLRFDARLLTFEMEKVSRDPVTRKIAMAAIMEAISSRAAARKGSARTWVAVDEAHEYLGNDASAESFLDGCYAKMRKYDVAMWTISQKFETFMNCRVAPTIIGNSAIKLFLWHSSGHDVIGKYFQLPPRALAAFAGLERRVGHFSDAFLLYGQHTATLRMAVPPLAYWILTTDGEDKRLLERAIAKNPTLSRQEVLTNLAELYPHGARGPAVATPRADARTPSEGRP